MAEFSELKENVAETMSKGLASLTTASEAAFKRRSEKTPKTQDSTVDGEKTTGILRLNFINVSMGGINCRR